METEEHQLFEKYGQKPNAGKLYFAEIQKAVPLGAFLAENAAKGQRYTVNDNRG